jgi:rhomboid protease GluP
MIAISIILLFLSPWSGLISLISWSLGLGLPILGWRRLNDAIAQHRYDRAHTLAVALRWLHPWDGWSQFPRLIKLLSQGDLQANPPLGPRCEFDSVLTQLKSPQFRPTLLKNRIIARLYILNARWQELCDWFESDLLPSSRQGDPVLFLCYLRALGETNAIAQLLWQIREFELWSAGNHLILNRARLLGLAFCGQEKAVQQLLTKELKACDPAIAQFWQLTAEMVQGKDVIDAFLQLSDRNDLSLNQAIAWRLSHPPQLASQTLTDPIATQILYRLQSSFAEEVSYGGAFAFNPRFAKATSLLIALNFITFILQLWASDRGSGEMPLLWGALIPAALVRGQWWRVLSANFLHAGYLHLSANMLGLYLLGPFVEFRFGAWRYLSFYLLTGMGAMSLYAAIGLHIGESDRLLIGASAAVMGILGAIAAILLKGWLWESSAIAARRLRLAAFIIGLQTILDLLIPQVSILAHLLGLSLGFAIALVLSPVNHRKSDGKGG